MSARTALASTYGKLAVGRSYRIGARYMTEVTCVCGTVKSVFTSGLRAGRVMSCGKSGCREKHYARRASHFDEAVRPEWLRAVWRNVTQENLSVRAVASRYAVAPSTLYYVIRRMREHDGPEGLIEWERAHSRS